MIVACALRRGGVYDIQYVRELARGVARHLPVPYRFVCLTDFPFDAFADMPGVLVYPLEFDWPGWWAKIELFKLYDADGVICFDLDTVIVGNLMPLVDAVRKERRLITLRELGGALRSQTAIIAWAGTCDWPIVTFPAVLEKDKNKVRFEHHTRSGSWALIANGVKTRGDGEWLHASIRARNEPIAFVQDIIPNQVFSYKWYVRRNGLPQSAAIVCFHGLPRPHELQPRPAWLWPER